MKSNNSNSLGLKLFGIIILALVLLIPSFSILALINERQVRRDDAMREVSSKWGSEQTLFGPVISVPYSLDGRNSYFHFLPASLKIAGDLDSNELKRGIYEIITYSGRLDLTGNFDFHLDDLSVPADVLEWDQAIFSVSISDMRGLKDEAMLDWNQNKYELKPMNLKMGASSDLALGTKLNLPWETITQNEHTYSLAIDLNGVESLSFIPAGAVTEARLMSSWPTPSFDGEFLPQEREVSENGFMASWKILEVNRNLPQSWAGESVKIADSSAGVRFIMPVDEYQKITRSVKYAILVIGLTFLIFFFVEVLNKKRIHPFQYTLVGIALVLFFSLLLALSEHVVFNLAYLIAAVATILVISMYSKHIFRNWKLSIFQALCLAAIYVFIFVIIQLQDYALLVGNIGLFVILVIIMFVSRKINWYEVGSGKEKENAEDRGNILPKG